VHFLATVEVTFEISAVFKTFVIAVLWLQRSTIVRVDLKPH
jgi:hypothetical protein